MRRLRAALATDYPALSHIKELAAWANPGDHGFLKANPQEARTLEPGEKWVVESHDRLLGYAAFERFDAKTFRLDGLFVDPAFMAQGIGKQLVGCSLMRARQQGGERLIVDPNPHAAAFYDACGFQPAPDFEDATLELRSARFTGKPVLSS